MNDVAWSPDGNRLVAVTGDGSLIDVTNNNSHSIVANNGVGVCIMLAAFFLLIFCLVVGMRHRFAREPCRRW